jgi:acetyltransferase
MYHYSRNLELLYETPAELPIDVAPAKHNLYAMLRRVAATGRLVLTEEESKHFVTTYGMPIVRQSTACSVDEALKAATEIGYPIVLKVVSHAITHKNAVGGVEVDVCSSGDLELAYSRIMTRVQENVPDAEIEGIAVQKMVRDVDYELILGMKKDWQFGSVLVFGAGGVGAEGLADFSVSLPPLNQVLARRMMEETRIFKTMRKSPKGVQQPDFCEIEELLTMLSNMVVDFPEIAEIDINPVVISKGQAFVVDARIVIDESVLSGEPKRPHLVITPYPTRYVSPWRLSDGTEVLLRPIRPEDEPMLAEMLATVSAQSLRFRFFGNVPAFDHDRLVRFTNNDYDREIAIVAELAQGTKKRIIGVARLMGDPERGPGEFATLIHDEFQGKGLGFKLIDVMIGIAHEKGFDALSGFVASNNQRMLRVVEQLGFRRLGTEECVTEIRLDLG